MRSVAAYLMVIREETKISIVTTQCFVISTVDVGGFSFYPFREHDCRQMLRETKASSFIRIINIRGDLQTPPTRCKTMFQHHVHISMPPYAGDTYVNDHPASSVPARWVPGGSCRSIFVKGTLLKERRLICECPKYFRITS